MAHRRLYNVNVSAEEVLITPRDLFAAHPVSDAAERTVYNSRQAIQDIIDGNDQRLLVIVGPCSIHDLDAAREYASKLKPLHDRLADTMHLVMRVYFEKPRTSVGWKGLINDPYLDDSFQVEAGLRMARELLLWVAELGLPAATEALDPITPEYLADLVCWAAIGARTTESQTHREMASGLSMPVGIKNGTDGDLGTAVNALRAVSAPHHFLGINHDGQSTVLHTRGNAYSHVVLRGGKRENYDAASVAACAERLESAGIPPRILIDCSHSNSHKKPERQPLVAEDVVQQVLAGNRNIIGLMIESHLNWGQQDLNGNAADLKYGVSITDACIDWDTTEELLTRLAERLARGSGPR